MQKFIFKQDHILKIWISAKGTQGFKYLLELDEIFSPKEWFVDGDNIWVKKLIIFKQYIWLGGVGILWKQLLQDDVQEFRDWEVWDDRALSNYKGKCKSKNSEHKIVFFYIVIDSTIDGFFYLIKCNRTSIEKRCVWKIMWIKIFQSLLTFFKYVFGIDSYWCMNFS